MPSSANWNGRGYRTALQEMISPYAPQVVGLADVYDALTNERVYVHTKKLSLAIRGGECGCF